MKTPAELMRESRDRTGKTQEQIAAEIGETQPLVSRWESDKGAPFLGDVRRVARAYGIRETTLLNAVIARAEIRATRRRKAKAS